MMINKNNLVIAELLDKDKYSSGGLYITKDRTVANNGRCLIEITRPKVNGKEFPAIPKVEPKQENDFIISAKTCKEISSIIPKKTSHDILKNVVIEQTDNKRASFSTTDLETARTVHAMLVEGQYPDYKQVYPAKKPIFTIGFSSVLLEKICSIINKAQAKSDKRIKLEFYGADDAVKLMAVNADTEQEITALIMPMDLEEEKNNAAKI